MKKLFLSLCVLILSFSFRQGEEYDYLNWDEIKINGEIPLKTSLAELEKHFGKADSVLPGIDDCGMYFDTVEYKKYYFKGIEFEVAENEAVFRTIDFRNSTQFLTTPKGKLSRKTTVKDLKKYFPKSYINRGKTEIHGIEGKFYIIQLYTGKEFTDDMFYIFFEEKSLFRIDYWLPC